MLSDRILQSHAEPLAARFNWGQLIKRRKRARSWQLDAELADFIAALSLLTRNGVPIHVSLAWLAPRTAGKLGEIVRALSSELKLGASLQEALEWFAAEVGGQLAGEFAQKVSVSTIRGTPLADQLEQLCETAQTRISHQLVQRAGSSETKMLVPTIFVALPVTVLFAIYPSLSLLGSQL